MRFTILLLLTACGPDQFTVIGPVGDSGGDPEGSSPLDAQGSETSDDGGGLDARDESKDSSIDVELDAQADASCPTGTNACNDAVTSWCARMKACCNGGCAYAWANAGGQQCAAQVQTGMCTGKMVCETQCLSDLQSANCTDIKNSPAPAYVNNSCCGLWQ